MDIGKKEIFNFLYVLMIIVVLFTCFYFINFLRSNAKKCMSDPVSFFEEKNKAYCMCYRETGGKMVKISKGNTHEREKNLSESNYIDVNITNAEKGNNEG